jgi:Bacterial dipeptidyl-peptidase Sh3 domain
MASPRPTARSSDRRPPTRISAEQFALTGPSNLPDPASHAYRRDLADIALAGRVIASHYAEPVERVVTRSTRLRSGPSEEADSVRELAADEPFSMLDDTLGWAWGYAGRDRRVGYVPSEILA